MKTNSEVVSLIHWLSIILEKKLSSGGAGGGKGREGGGKGGQPFSTCFQLEGFIVPSGAKAQQEEDNRGLEF